MVKLSDLPTADEVHVKELTDDPEYRDEWERTAFARAVAMQVLGYRTEHGLTQTQLARKVGMTQPQIARLEGGDRTPSLATLARLSQALGIEFHIAVTPSAPVRLHARPSRRSRAVAADGSPRHQPATARTGT